jgi:hypothetical protein
MKLLCGSALLIGVSGFGGTTETLPPTWVMPMTPPTPEPMVFPPIFPPTAAPEIVWPEVVWPPTMAPEIVWPEVVWPPVVEPEVVWPPVVQPVLPQPVVTDATGRSCAGKCFSTGREGLPVLESYQEYTVIEGPDGALFQVRSMCSCDSECERFGDCCNDYTAVCLAGVATGGEWEWSQTGTVTTEPAGEWVVSPTGELVWSTDVQTSVYTEPSATGQWVQSASGEWVWSTSTDASATGTGGEWSSNQWNTGTGGESSSTQAAGQFVQDATGQWVWTTTGVTSSETIMYPSTTETIMYPSTTETIVYPSTTETIMYPSTTETIMYPGMISSETVYTDAAVQPAGQFVQSATGEWVWTEGEAVSSTSEWNWTPAASSSMRKAGPSGFVRGKRTEAIPVVATTIVSAGDNVNYVCQNKRAIIGEADKGKFESGVSAIECEQKCSEMWGCQSYTFGSLGYCELWSIPDSSVASTTHKMCNKGDDGSFACQMNRAIEGRGQLKFFEGGFSEERCQLACKNNAKCKSLVWGEGSCKLWSIHEYSVDHEEFTTCSRK